MNDQPAVVGTVLDYYAAFNTFEVPAILPYFHEPAQLIGPQGAFAATTHDVLAPALATQLAADRAGWERCVVHVDILGARIPHDVADQGPELSALGCRLRPSSLGCGNRPSLRDGCSRQ